MGAGAIGSFAQGLVQGYRVGDEMRTADSRRKYIDQQTALDEQKTEAAKMEIQRKKDIDAAGKELAAAAAGIMPNPDGTMPSSGAIADPAKEQERIGRWNSAYTNYIGKVKPEALEALRLGRKEEALKDYARGVTQTVAGLMNGDPNALASAQKLYGYVPDGFQIDPSQSGFERDDAGRVLGVNFAVKNSQTGAVQMVRKTPGQIHQLAFAGLMRPDELLTSVDREARREEVERANRENADIRREAGEIRREELASRREDRAEMRAGRAQREREFATSREDRMWQDFAIRGIGMMRSTLDLEADNIKNSRSIDFADPAKKEAAIQQLSQRRAIGENAFLLNSDLKIRTSPSDMLEAARSYQNKTLQLMPVSDGKGGYRTDIGRLPSGAYFPILPGMNPPSK